MCTHALLKAGTTRTILLHGASPTPIPSIKTVFHLWAHAIAMAAGTDLTLRLPTSISR